MGRSKKRSDSAAPQSLPPALTPEAQENRMISLATRLAEQKMLDGTASSQLIVHYLKLGSSKERLEKEIMEKQKELISAKTDALQTAKRVEELYDKAIKAMRVYSGQEDSEYDEADVYGTYPTQDF